MNAKKAKSLRRLAKGEETSYTKSNGTIKLHPDTKRANYQQCKQAYNALQKADRSVINQ